MTSDNTKMLNITDLCRAFNKTSEVRKLPAHFLQLNQCKACFADIKRIRGVSGCTYIPLELGKLFTCWLSPEYNMRVYNGEDWQDVLRELTRKGLRQ